MGIEHGGVDGVKIIVNGVVIETIEPIAFENILRGAPIGLAMFQTISESVEIVREFVEPYHQLIGTI
jgi:hypothetical protein